MGSEEVQSVVSLNPWEFTQKQFMGKPWVDVDKSKDIIGTRRAPVLAVAFPRSRGRVRPVQDA